MTQQSIKYLIQMTHTEGASKNFIWMTPNIALAKNTFNRMKDVKSTNLYNTGKKKRTKTRVDRKLRKFDGVYEFIKICLKIL